MLGTFTGLNVAFANSFALFISKNKNTDKGDEPDGRVQQLTAVILKGMLC